MKHNLRIKRWIQKTSYLFVRPYGFGMPEPLKQIVLKLDKTALPAYDGVIYAEDID